MPRADVKGQKVCAACGSTKDIDAFPIDRARADGLYPYCRLCHSAKESRRREDPDVVIKKRASSRDWYRRQDPVRVKKLHRINHLRRKYGLTPDQLQEIFLSQGERCALCGSTSPRTPHGWSTDHDHVTGMVRGILCRVCNHYLGLIESGWIPPSPEAVESYFGGNHAVARR